MNDEVPGSSSNIDGPDLETLDYLRGVKSSTCLLLPTTPSPHPLDFKHPLSEEMKENQFEILNDGTNMINLQSLDPAAGDSSSSGDSNSVIQDPVSAQLINKISMLDYQTLSKNGDIIMGQEEDCKLNGNISANNRKLPSFVNWNWVIIRKFLFWIVLSGLIACLGTIIAMVITIPKTCNPDLPWYQGKVFYEVFPASFEDSNNDGIGDLKGLIKKIDYINDLGASAIRLNYIYKSKKYPEDYKSITSLLNIHESLGFAKDFQNLVTVVHNKNMSLVLDIPVWSMVTPKHSSNASHIISFVNDTIVTEIDPTTAALLYWAKNQSVDGFYLKDLENFVDDLNFARTLQVWKQIVGMDKIFIASEEAFEKSTGANRNVLLNRIDLIDVHLDLHDGIDGLKNRIDKIITGPLWEKAHYPWVHWNIGDIKSERISTKHFNNTLALIALEFSLPGTVSIFYGDEIGLTDLQPQEVEQDFLEHHQLHNLVPMAFSNNNNKRILPWNSGSDLKPQYHFLEYIKMLTGVRLSTPTLYLRSIYKEGHIMKNTEVRKTQKNLVVIERWHPRRNTCVFVGNLGDKAITTDLSAMYYGGLVVAGTNASLVGQVIYFDEVTFLPNSAIILKLEK